MKTLFKITERRLVVLLVAVHVALAVMSMRHLSLTWDEPSYIGAGYQFLVTGDPHPKAMQLHPPLSYYLNGLLLMPLKLDTTIFQDDRYVHREYVGPPLIFESEYSPSLLMFLSRLPFVFVSALLGIVIWRWSRRLYGAEAGILSLFLYAFAPLVLAHCRLATPDITLALTTTGALVAFHRFLLRPSRAAAILSGLTLGLALLSKFTALLLIPIFLFLLYMHQRERADALAQRDSDTQSLIRLAAIFGVAIGVVWAGYGFQAVVPFVPEWLHADTHPRMLQKPFWRVVELFKDKGIRIPLYSYVLGIRTQLAAAKGWKNNFLFGHVSQDGWWYFYWLAFLIKNTVPFLICLAAGLWSCRGREQGKSGLPPAPGERLLWYSIIPLALFFSLPTRINIGVRYILPLFPLLCIVAGKAVFVFRGKWRYALVALCAWQVLLTLWIHPYYLAYFNELVGGPSNGYRFLVDSNLDWGQELDRLAEYLKRNDIDGAKLRYFGPPEVLKYYGLKNVKPEESEPSPGLWAVSATNLQGLYLQDNEDYRWLLQLKPAHVIGYSIFIYELSREDLTERGPL